MPGFFITTQYSIVPILSWWHGHSLLKVGVAPQHSKCHCWLSIFSNCYLYMYQNPKLKIKVHLLLQIGADRFVYQSQQWRTLLAAKKVMRRNVKQIEAVFHANWLNIMMTVYLNPILTIAGTYVNLVILANNYNVEQSACGMRLCILVGKWLHAHGGLSKSSTIKICTWCGVYHFLVTLAHSLKCILYL